MFKPAVDAGSAVSLGRAQALTTHSPLLDGDIVYATPGMDIDDGNTEP
jgi:hypothetical protein